MFNYQHPSIVPSSQRNLPVDENAGIGPTATTIMNKPITTNIQPIKLSKPYISSVSSNTQPQGTTQRTCLGDISNQVHHLQQKSVLSVASKPQVIKPNLPSSSVLPPNSSNNSVPISLSSTTTSTTTTTRLLSKPHRLASNNDHAAYLSSSSSAITNSIPTNTTLTTLNDKDNSSSLLIPSSLQDPPTLSSPPPKKPAQRLLNSPKIDENDSSDPQSCTEYIKEIMSHYKAIERKYLADCNYMSRQNDLHPNMRAILVDWLIDVHYKFKLVPETLYLTVNLIDRFLSERTISRQRLQLVGITAMFIASKYEEIISPIVADFVKITKDAYTREEVLKMERIMLQVLDFNLTIASPNVFLKRYLKCGRCTELQTYIAIYLSELSLMDYAQLEFTPSTVACAAVYLSKHLTQDFEKWDSTMEHYTDKTEEDILPCAKAMLRYLKKISSQRRDANNKPLVAAVNKYKKEDRLSASRVCAKMADTVNL